MPVVATFFIHIQPQLAEKQPSAKACPFPSPEMPNSPSGARREPFSLPPSFPRGCTAAQPLWLNQPLSHSWHLRRFPRHQHFPTTVLILRKTTGIATTLSIFDPTDYRVRIKSGWSLIGGTERMPWAGAGGREEQGSPRLRGFCSQSSSAPLAAAMPPPSIPARLPGHWAGGMDSSQHGQLLSFACLSARRVTSLGSLQLASIRKKQRNSELSEGLLTLFWLGTGRQVQKLFGAGWHRESRHTCPVSLRN